MAEGVEIYKALVGSFQPNAPAQTVLIYKTGVIEALLLCGKITASEFFDLRAEAMESYKP